MVAENGTGKSLLLAIMVNFMISARQAVYEDSEVEKGRVYKLRSPTYISSGQNYYFTNLLFDNDIRCVEWQLNRTRKDFELTYRYTPTHSEWNKIPEAETSHLWNNLPEKETELKSLINQNCFLYFPANRFEEPAWLNSGSLVTKAAFSYVEHFLHISNRRIVQHAALKANQDWLLDLLFDRNEFERVVAQIPVSGGAGPTASIPAIVGYNGNSSRLLESILQVLQAILQAEDKLQLRVGDRFNRQISIIHNARKWVPNLFQLSTGQTSLLNLFLTIIRDFELGANTVTSLPDVRGLVLIDEIELHLHSNLQYEVLPNLIKLFPKVQFVITSQSPLFLLGLQHVLGNGGFHIVEMPSGRQITTEEFAEFESAYKCFKETRSHDESIRKAVMESHKPIIFMEGNYDGKYLRIAAEVPERAELIEKFRLIDGGGGGFGDLNNVWRYFNTRVAEATSQKVILLYDCDVETEDRIKRNVMRKTIEFVDGTPILKGIENLFPRETIEKAIAHKSAFIDVTDEHKETKRGKDLIIPKTWKVNPDEKGNLCNWICKIGTREDFANFKKIFDFLERLVESDSRSSIAISR